MLARRIGDARAGEHPRQFVDTRIAVQRLQSGLRPAADTALRDPHLSVGLRRHLRQVRHAQHLARRGQHAQLPTDHLGNGPTHAGIHLVEDQAGQVGRVQRRDLQCEADPRQFAAGGGFRQRTRRLAGVRADQELDV